MNTVTTRLIALPTTIRAYTVLDAEADYTICINSRISYEQQLMAYEHELKHINSNDFEKENIQQIEAEAHRKED